MNSIGSIQGVRAGLPVSAAAPRGPADAAGPSFKDCLIDSIRRLNQTSSGANQAATASPDNGIRVGAQSFVDSHRAELVMRLTERVGDRLAAAYDEIKQIRV